MKEKDKAEIIAIATEINSIYDNYVLLCKELYAVYLLVYKKNGTLLDEGLKKEAKKQKEKKDEKIELHLLDVDKQPLLHLFIFKSIKLFVEQANRFYEKVTTGDFNRIQTDFNHIDTSAEQMGIKDYEPIADKKFTDGLRDDDFKKENDIEYSQEEESKQKLVAEINRNDVQQGALGDCYFLSAVESLAEFSPETIYSKDSEDSIITGPNAEGDYTVQLYVPDTENQGETKRIKIKVAPIFLKEKVTKKGSNTSEFPTISNPLAKASATNEMWVQLLEKALAQLEGSYNEIEGDNKDIRLSGIEILIGKKATTYILPTDIDKAIDAIISYFEKNKKVPMAQFGTKDAFTDMSNAKTADSGEFYTLYRPDTRLYAKHAYSLMEIVQSTNGNEIFKLQNPHNKAITDDNVYGGKTIEVNRAELIKYFELIQLT